MYVYIYTSYIRLGLLGVEEGRQENNTETLPTLSELQVEARLYIYTIYIYYIYILQYITKNYTCTQTYIYTHYTIIYVYDHVCMKLGDKQYVAYVTGCNT